MFYGPIPIAGAFVLDEVVEGIKKRVNGKECSSSKSDSMAHWVLMLLSAAHPHLTKVVERIELHLFRQRVFGASAESMKENLRNFIDSLQVFSENKKIQQIIGIAQIMLFRVDHAFSCQHRESCKRRKILISFTFPTNLVGQRKVEVKLGVATVPCGLWRLLLLDMFQHLLAFELHFLKTNESILPTALYHEDDRIRRMIAMARTLLGDNSDSKMAPINAVDRECRFFPPCMVTLHQILRKTHRLSYDSRVEYTLFLKDAGLSLEANLNLWKTEYSRPAEDAQCCHEWLDKKSRYIYQIKHLYGHVGDGFEKKSHCCDRFIERAPQKSNACCPFTLAREEMSAAFPDQLRENVGPVFEFAAEGNPREACARYLSLQRPHQVAAIMRPIHYYQLARGIDSSSTFNCLFVTDKLAMSALQGRHGKHGRIATNRNIDSAHTNPTIRCYSGSETDVSTSTENLSHEERYVIRHTERQEPQGQENLPVSNRSSLDASICSYNTLIIHQDDGDSKRTSRLVEPGRSITDIPDDFLSESQVLKHLAKEAKTAQQDEAPSSQLRSKNFRRSKLRKSKSQPDLRPSEQASNTGTYRRARAAKEGSMVDALQEENSRLLIELESLSQKLAKTDKLEHELNKVHRAQEELVESSERRGRLEREARTRLQEMNRALRDQVELLSVQTVTSRVPTGDALRRELNNRDILITQLIASNKELSACKERQEIELAAQRVTLQEQRTHIDILDTALTNAQGNVVRLEEECRKKQMYAELVTQMKQALVTQQQASERREQTEQMLRLQLERELRAERGKSSASDNASGSSKRFGSTSSGSGTTGNSSSEYSAELKRKLREKDERIMMLEAENAKMEQRYIEESALRHAAIEAASLPKDAKIAALEKTSQDTERLILEARTEKMRHMDEQHAAQKMVADLQDRVKHLESRLAERDAMIKVLHKHTYDKGFSELSRQEIGGSSSAFSSVTSALTSSTGFTSYSGSDSSSKLFYSSAYHPATSVSDSAKISYHGGDASSKLSYGGESSSKLSYSGDSTPITTYGSFRGQYSAGQSFDDTKKSLDDQLKELDSQLDSQLLSKRGLCCFPGFSNPGTSPRKGKISQPLLASVAGLGGLVRGEPPARPEEMMLLEKQGRSSQRQRAGSLPPSSLPRPRRPRKLGEYGRLSDSETARKTSTDESFTHHQYAQFDNLSESNNSEQVQRPPASSSPSFSYARLKTPPIEVRKIDYASRPPSTPTKLDFPNYPRLKTPPYDGSLTRKRSKENSPSVSSTVSQMVGLGRFRTPPPLEPGQVERATPPPGVTRCSPSPKLDLSRCVPPSPGPSASSPKKSFIPPPRKLGDYSRFGGRSSSDSSSATPQHSADSTPNYRIRF